MDIHSIIKEFCDRYSIEGVAPEKDGSTFFKVDDQEVGILKSPTEESITICAEFGDPPESFTSEFSELLLKANFLYLSTEGGTLSQNPGNNKYVFMLPLRLEGLDTDGFVQKLDRFLVKLEEYQILLKAYNPKAASSDNDSVSSQSSLSAFSQMI
ncbi:type III secretion system chaperone [Succinivibrio sp.]|uniref:type III secretion system chaperone n=1 Tax=Succinivibrio sp. TaxID=2053619 RepID=UPI003868038B